MGYTTMNKLLLAALMTSGVLAASNASALAISGSELTLISGQNGSFTSTGLPLADGDGALQIILEGDFSSRTTLSEFARITFDTAPGTMELNNNGGTPVVFSSSITGLTLDSTAFSGGGNDTSLTYNFSVAESLLNSVLGDGTFTFLYDLSDDVNPNTGNADRVAFSLDYDPEAFAAVPLPATLPLLAMALGFLGWRARR